MSRWQFQTVRHFHWNAVYLRIHCQDFRPLTGKPLTLGTLWSQCVTLRTRFDSQLPDTQVSSLDTVQDKKVYGLKTQSTDKAPWNTTTDHVKHPEMLSLIMVPSLGLELSWESPRESKVTSGNLRVSIFITHVCLAFVLPAVWSGWERRHAYHRGYRRYCAHKHPRQTSHELAKRVSSG